MTPADQAGMRAQTRATTSTGRRGRPRKTTKKDDSKDDDSKPRTRTPRSMKADPKATPMKRTPRASPKAKSKAKAKPSPKPRSRASRKPEVVEAEPGSEKSDEPTRKLGCGRCRMAPKGCKTCRNPDYRPHKK